MIQRAILIVVAMGVISLSVAVVVVAVTSPAPFLHVVAVAQTLFVYAVLAVSYFGWGWVAARALRIGESSAVMRVWLGWAVVLLIFQLLHLAFALNPFVIAPVFLIGVMLASPRLAMRVRGLRFEQGRLMLAAGLALLIVAAAAWIASGSMLVPGNYDTGLYHLATIRWINSFPIVPGLGNLHGRLAFNQAYFTYAASLNIAPLFTNGSRVANGFLLLLAAMTLLARLRPVAARPALLWESHPFEYLPSVFALPILGSLTLFSYGLASPAPDVASVILQLVMFVILADIARRSPAGQDGRPAQTAILTILAATAITIKLTNLVFSVVVIAIVLGLAHRMRELLRVSVLIAVVFTVWIARSYVSSGAPLYPSTIGYIAFDWSVPRHEVANMAALIRGWAREPNKNWAAAVEKGTWVKEWNQRIRLYHHEIIVPLRLSLFFFAAACILGALRKPGPWRELLLLVPVLAGLAFWLFTAPDPRFAHALFFCLPIGAALLFLKSIQPWISGRSFALILCAAFAATHFGLALQAIRGRNTIQQIPFAGWQPIPLPPLIPRTTASGLVVLTPVLDDKCWDAPLPCTPYFRDDLRLRVPGRLESGFAVTPAE